MASDSVGSADSRAVLIGVSAYEDAELPPIRAARNSLQAMHALLSDPALCGWAPERITVISNPDHAADLAARIADLAEDTTGTLLLYYVGHGLLSARGELCLTVTSTRLNRPKISGLHWDILMDVLRGCPAKVRLVILDCCFAGQAIEALSGDGESGLADIAHVEGIYTLTATTRNRTAHVPRPDQQEAACTSFTGELRDLVRSGIPDRPPQLTFGDIYPVLRQRLHAKGLPAPSQRGTETVHQFRFTANAAARIGPDAHNVRPDGTGLGEADLEPVAQSPLSRKDEARRKMQAAMSQYVILQSLKADPSDKNRVINRMRELAPDACFRQEEIAEYLESTDVGERFAALASVQWQWRNSEAYDVMDFRRIKTPKELPEPPEDPSKGYFPQLLEILCRSWDKFENYHATVAMWSMVNSLEPRDKQELFKRVLDQGVAITCEEIKWRKFIDYLNGMRKSLASPNG
jgi:Caspase domain